ncbi:MAG: 3-hydroxyacyl-ACP dehydratase FabZ [Candidatus Dasytiphilus stammeri]
MYIEEIIKILPHRFPFLLIDRIIHLKKGHSLCAIKNVSINDPFLSMHFPHHPIVPGVLIIESLAQASWILAVKSWGTLKTEDFYYLVGIDKARFKRIVVPGDQMILKIEWIKERQGLIIFQCLAKVKKELACTALIKCILRKRSLTNKP